MQLGALRSWVGLSHVQRGRGAVSRRTLGRVRACAWAAARAARRRTCGAVGLVLTALLEVSRGRDDAAAARHRRPRTSGVDERRVARLLGAAQAQVALNHGDLDAAHRAAVEGLDASTGAESQEMVDTVTLAGLGLRIEADRAQVARARHDPTGGTGGGRVRPIRRGSGPRAASPGLRRGISAGDDACPPGALGGRARPGGGRSEPDAVASARASAARGIPHRTAVRPVPRRRGRAGLPRRPRPCRRRAHLRPRHRPTRLGPSRSAGRSRALARRACIELTDQPSPATGLRPPSPDSHRSS